MKLVACSFPWQSAATRARLLWKLKCIEFRLLVTLARYFIPPHAAWIQSLFRYLIFFLSLLWILSVFSSDRRFLIIFLFFCFCSILENNCSWCHQLLQSSSQSNEIIGSSGAVFCSENCFLFWRRASFKRAKTCDFCKNVRNAVSYVDFNDGTIQLQFCSDKCLNQYKMQIFCRETQAQLELNPHLKDNKSEAAGKLSDC